MGIDMIYWHNIKTAVLVSVIAVFFLCGITEAQYTMGILDLEAEGISLSEAKILSDELRFEITRLSKSDEYINAGYPEYNIVERSEMNKILSEFEFSQCVSDSCAIEFGRMLSADRMIFGLVGKIGGTYTFSIRMIDVETAKSIYIARKHYRGPVDELLTTVVKEVTKELIIGAAKESGEIAIPVTEPEAETKALTETTTETKTDERFVLGNKIRKKEPQTEQQPRLTTKRGWLENGWFVAPAAKFTMIQEEPAVFGGTRLGWIVNHKVVIGVHGYANLMEVEANNAIYSPYTYGYLPTMTDKALKILNYGVDVEYIGNSEKLYQYSLHVLAGIFDCGLESSDGNVRNRSIYIEPELTVSYNVTEWFRLCCGVSYRMVSDSSLEGYEDSDFSKPAVTVTFELGRF